jgi:hypothetical protein
LLTDAAAPCSVFFLETLLLVSTARLDFFSSFLPFSSRCFNSLVRLGRLGVSIDEFGKSDSEELALDLCILSRLHTRWIRFEPSLPFPFSRLRLEAVVDDEIVVEAVDAAVDSPFFTRFVRVVTTAAAADEEDEIFELRGKLSRDDCDEAVQRERDRDKGVVL